MTGEDITLFAGAKTAPGVHALCQTVNFHTESPFSDTYFLSKLNEYLPKDIHILSSEIVSDRFRSDFKRSLQNLFVPHLYRPCPKHIHKSLHGKYTGNHLGIRSCRHKKGGWFSRRSPWFSFPFRSKKEKRNSQRNIWHFRFPLQRNRKRQLFASYDQICANDFLYLMPEHIIEFLIKKGVDKEVRCNPAGLLLHSITYPDSCSVPSAGSKQV
mgnify:CR=1 FL=1